MAHIKETTLDKVMKKVYEIDEMRILKVSAICDVSLKIISKIKEGETITKDEKFAIVDSHKELFFLFHDLNQENKELKKKLSDAKYEFNQLLLKFNNIFKDIEILQLK